MTKNKQPAPFPLLVLLLAWLIPGAGHIYLRRYTRGIIILVTIGSMFWAGVAFGGALTMDYYAERWWFAAQMLTGVHGMASWQRQNAVYDRLRQDPTIEEEVEKVLSERRSRDAAAIRQGVIEARLAKEGVALVTPTDTVARAYTGVAGLLNLLCIFDAVLLSLMGISGERPVPREPRKAEQ